MQFWLFMTTTHIDNDCANNWFWVRLSSWSKKYTIMQNYRETLLCRGIFSRSLITRFNMQPSFIPIPLGGSTFFNCADSIMDKNQFCAQHGYPEREFGRLCTSATSQWYVYMAYPQVCSLSVKLLSRIYLAIMVKLKTAYSSTKLLDV